MPEICRFHGIVVSMHWVDHTPPHFHAIFGCYEAMIAIEGLDIVGGSLPGPQLRRVRTWAAARHAELVADWTRAQAGRPLEPVDPLP